MQYPSANPVAKKPDGWTVQGWAQWMRRRADICDDTLSEWSAQRKKDFEEAAAYWESVAKGKTT